ncbi:DNA gyrase inhibitor YacG [Cribrihabitans sp. XS_ASV171]
MTCPICGEPTARAFRPFCSKRCADIDLARWLKGSYALPSEDEPEAEDLASEPNPSPRRNH